MEPKDEISPRRKQAYNLGLILIIVGFIFFFSFFIYGALAIAGVARFSPPVGVLLAPPIGMLLTIAGGFLRTISARGTAGSGLILNPRQARKDLKPWSHMGGGIVKDALDEAGISFSGNRNAPSSTEVSLPFDEQLRRLHRLHEEGLISKDEYEAKRKQILDRM